MANRVAIVIQGGVMQCIAADQKIEIIRLDYDYLEEAGLQEIRNLGPTSEVPDEGDVDTAIQAYEDERAKRLAYLLEG